MLDIISIGTISIDIYYQSSSLTHTKDRFELALGGKYFTEHFYEGLGGGGANVAIGLQKQGVRAGLIARIGDNPFRQIISHKLDQAGLRYRGLCHVEKDYWNISSILLTPEGERTIINYRSPHQHIFDHSHEEKRLLAARAVYMASLSQVSLTERIRILKFAKLHDLTTFANLNVTDCRRPVEEIFHFLQFVDVLIINTHECADIVKTSVESIDFHHDITRSFLPFHPGMVLVVTDGKKGSYAYHQHKHWHEPAVSHVRVVDTTGAGDGYTAGFIASYLDKRDVPEAMNAGAAYAVNILRILGAN